jgi:hypothetical protein
MIPFLHHYEVNRLGQIHPSSFFAPIWKMSWFNALEIDQMLGSMISSLL